MEYSSRPSPCGLMCEPTFDDAGEGEAMDIERKIGSHAVSRRFILPKEKSYKTQYSHLYFHRLALARPLVVEATQQQYGGKVKVLDRVLDINKENGGKCVVVGTLYKAMDQKPHILKDYKDEMWVPAPPPKEKYLGEDDSLVLEDESGRVQLCGKLNIEQLVTGIVVGLYGSELENGTFNVEEIVSPGLAPQPSVDLPGEASYIVLISGMRIGDEDTASSLFPLQVFVDYVSGHLGGPEDHKIQSQIARVIVAGNTVTAPPPLSASEFKVAKSSEGDMQKRMAPIRQSDLFLTQLASAVPIDIMPGEKDPATFVMPQQPMNRALFTKAGRFSTFVPVCNPHEFQMENLTILGTSGQNIDDLDRYTMFDSRLTLLEKTLHWRHLAPTSPDTLAVYPYQDNDPFLVTSTPHIYFAANQPEFDTKMIEGKRGQRTRLILVPDFSATGQAVLVNLHTLDCSPISFAG